MSSGRSGPALGVRVQKRCQGGKPLSHYLGESLSAVARTEQRTSREERRHWESWALNLGSNSHGPSSCSFSDPVSSPLASFLLLQELINPLWLKPVWIGFLTFATEILTQMKMLCILLQTGKRRLTCPGPHITTELWLSATSVYLLACSPSRKSWNSQG